VRRWNIKFFVKSSGIHDQTENTDILEYIDFSGIVTVELESIIVIRQPEMKIAI
jgi:hypothetical protein